MVCFQKENALLEERVRRWCSLRRQCLLYPPWKRRSSFRSSSNHDFLDCGGVANDRMTPRQSRLSMLRGELLC